jgi:hypothetical protein
MVIHKVDALALKAHSLGRLHSCCRTFYERQRASITRNHNINNNVAIYTASSAEDHNVIPAGLDLYETILRIPL